MVYTVQRKKSLFKDSHAYILFIGIASTDTLRAANLGNQQPLSADK